MKIELDHGTHIESRPDIADVMVVGGNLRYATMKGQPNKIDGGCVTKAVSNEYLTVGVKALATGKTKKFDDVRFVAHDPDEKMVYVSGPGMIDRVVGEIVRVRRQNLPQ